MEKYTFAFYPNGNTAEISVISETKADAEKLVRAMISDEFFDDGLSLKRDTKTTLYRALYSDFPYNQEWKFEPRPYAELLFVLDFLRNETDEDEKGRETRIMALLNGETVCTNLAAYKLVRE